MSIVALFREPVLFCSQVKIYNFLTKLCTEIVIILMMSATSNVHFLHCLLTQCCKSKRANQAENERINQQHIAIRYNLELQNRQKAFNILVCVIYFRYMKIFIIWFIPFFLLLFFLIFLFCAESSLKHLPTAANSGSHWIQIALFSGSGS